MRNIKQDSLGYEPGHSSTRGNASHGELRMERAELTVSILLQWETD